MKRLVVLSLLLACGGTVTTRPSDAGVDATVEPTCASIGAPVDVVANDDLGYPTYAIHGCRMAYVDATTHDLVLRDLTNGAERTLDTATMKPRRPVMSASVIAWEASMPPDYGQELVRVHRNGGVAALATPPSYESLGEPAVSGDTVVATAFKTAAADSDTDVFAFDVASGTVSAVVVAPAQQRFAAVSDGLIAVTDFSEDPKGYFSAAGGDLADIGVFDRATQRYDVRKHPGKDAFPAIVSGDVLGYLHWGDVHPEPKLEAYSLYTARIGADPTTDVHLADVSNALRYLRPSANAGRFEWVTQTLGESVLWRSDLVATPVAALDLANETMFAPVAFETGTLVARGASLVVVPR